MSFPATPDRRAVRHGHSQFQGLCLDGTMVLNFTQVRLRFLVCAAARAWRGASQNELGPLRETLLDLGQSRFCLRRIVVTLYEHRISSSDLLC